MFGSMLENPSKEILATFNGTSYLMALLALASTIAWIYYVSKAVEQNVIGDKHGNGSDETGNVSLTTEVMFEGTVIAVLMYFVFRHHFHHQ
jgi:hypothetical protein